MKLDVDHPISRLKRHNKYLKRELAKLTVAMERKKSFIDSAIDAEASLVKDSNYSLAKELKRERINSLKELELYVSLEVRLRDERYDTGIEILQERIKLKESNI